MPAVSNNSPLMYLSSSKPTVERYYFEMFGKAYSVPTGIIAYGDKPDVVLNGALRLGIEMTRFYVTGGRLPKSEQAQRKLREIAVAKGDQLYQ